MMGTVATNQSKSRYSRIWAAARSLGMDKEEVHEVVYREFEVTSLKELTDRQVEQMGDLLWDIYYGRRSYPRTYKRTDEGGREDNVKQRRKIFKLAEVLGWDEKSINRFSQTEYGVSRHEWLPPAKCSDMIEALKDIARREGKKL